MKKFFKKNWLNILSVGLNLFIIIFFVTTTINGEPGHVFLAKSISKLNKNFLFVCFLCVFMFWILDSYVLYIFVKLKYNTMSFKESFKTAMIGLFYSAITPFATGGQPMQIIEMNKKNIPTHDALTIISIKSVVYQVGLTIYGVTSYFLVKDLMNKHFTKLGFLVLVALFANLIFIFFIILSATNDKFLKKLMCKTILFLEKLKLIKDSEQRLNKIYTQIGLFKQSFDMVRCNVKSIILSIIITLFQLTIYYSVTFFLYKSFGLSGFSFVTIIATQSLLCLITAFVPTPGGSGAAEGSFHLLFKMIFSDNLIIPAMFIWRFITYYLCIIVGGFINFFDLFSGASIKKLKI